MDLDLTRRDRWFIGAIYGIPIVVLIAALAMAFNHAKDWAGRHNDGPSWEHWTFAAVIELPALLGLLLLTLWPKIGGGRKPTVPRILFLSAAGLSMFVQQAYAGSGASWSTRFVAALPSVAAGVFLELVFWVMGLVDEAKQEAAAEAERAALNQTRQALGLGDIEPPPTLTSAPMSPPAVPPMSPPPRPDIVPMSPDMSPRTSRAVSPDIQDDMSPDMQSSAAGHVTPDVPPTQADIPQVSPPATLALSSPWPWHDMADIGADTEAAERVVTLPDSNPAEPDVADIPADMSPDTDQADVTPARPDTGPDVTPTDGDMSPDIDAKKMTDPRWAEAAQMRRNGATVAAIADRFKVHTRTVTRWKLPEPDMTKPANGHVPDLTGATR